MSLMNKINFISNIRSSSIYNICRNALMKFIGPDERKIYSINDPFRIELLARLNKF